MKQETKVFCHLPPQAVPPSCEMFKPPKVLSQSVRTGRERKQCGRARVSLTGAKFVACAIIHNGSQPRVILFCQETFDTV